MSSLLQDYIAHGCVMLQPTHLDSKFHQDMFLKCLQLTGEDYVVQKLGVIFVSFFSLFSLFLSLSLSLIYYPLQFNFHSYLSLLYVV